MRRTPEGTRRAAIVLAALAVVLSLSGCFADEEPAPTTPPVPTATPVFATEEEALAAAEEAYANYLRVTDAIFADGGSNPERLLDVATESQFQRELVGYEELASDHLHGVGSSRFDSSVLQSFHSGDDSTAVIYTCLDISETDIRNSKGESTVAPGRIERFTTEVSFDLDERRLLVASDVPWTGESLC